MDNSDLPGTIIKTCEICGKEFQVYRYKIKRGGGRYCSNECKKKANTTRQKRICEYCGKEFEAHAYLIKNGGGKYCSKECYHAGSRHDIKCKCIVCGKEFTINKSQQEEGRGRYCSHKCADMANRGENHHAWKGGVSPVTEKIRKSDKYINWRDSIFARDEYKCRICGSNHNINAHHIIKFSSILEENNIKSYDDALLCEKLWDISNGITYCEKCHNILHGNVDKESSELYLMDNNIASYVAVHRKNRTEWLVTMRAEDFLRMTDNKKVIDNLGFL